MLGKLLGIASIGEAFSGFNFARKFVADFILIIILAIVGAIMSGALLTAGLYEGYLLLMRHGLDTDMAALITGFVTLLLLAGIGATIMLKIRKIQNFPFKAATLGGAISGPVQSLLRGFYQGLTEKPPL